MYRVPMRALLARRAEGLIGRIGISEVPHRLRDNSPRYRCGRCPSTRFVTRSPNRSRQCTVAGGLCVPTSSLLSHHFDSPRLADCTRTPSTRFDGRSLLRTGHAVGYPDLATGTSVSSRISQERKTRRASSRNIAPARTWRFNSVPLHAVYRFRQTNPDGDPT